MKNPVKSNGTYDHRSKEYKRSKGGSDAPKTTEKNFKKVLKAKNKPGK